MQKEFLVTFHKGLRQKDSPRIFKDGECSIAQDCYFDALGNIFSRKFMQKSIEFSSPIKTIFPYNYDNKLLIHLLDGSLYKNNISIGSSLGSNKYSCVEYNDIAYIVNGTYAKRYDGANLQNIGADGPSSAPTVDITGEQLFDCGTAFTPEANVTAEVDEFDYVTNPDDADDISSAKITIQGAFVTGLLATYTLGASVDITDYSSINFWIKSNKNVNSGDLGLTITDGVTPHGLELPALIANEWTLVSLTEDTLGTLIEDLDSYTITDVLLYVLYDISTNNVIVHYDDIRATVGGDLNGVYYYKYTYVDSNGKETSASDPSDAINVKKEAVNIDVTASSDSKIEYINLYRLGGTLSDWYLVTQVANTTQTIVDDAADSTLTTLFDADVNDAPPNGLSFLAEHYERIIGAKDTDYPNSAMFTDPYEPEYWGLNLSQQYLISNRDECTGLLAWGRYIIYCKKNRIYVFEGTNPTEWHIRKSDSKYGNISPWALNFYNLPVFLSYNGLYAFDANNDAYFSEKIKDLFTLHKSELSSCISCIYDDKYYLIFTDFILVYDFLAKIFYTYDLSLTEIAYNYLDGNMYAGDENNNLVLMEQDTNKNNYDSINFNVKSKAYPLHDIPNRKGDLQDYILNINTNSQDVTFNVYIDEVLKFTKTINTDEMTYIFSKFSPNLKGKYAEFQFTYTGTKGIEIDLPIIINPKDSNRSIESLMA